LNISLIFDNTKKCFKWKWNSFERDVFWSCYFFSRWRRQKDMQVTFTF